MLQSAKALADRLRYLLYEAFVNITPTLHFYNVRLRSRSRKDMNDKLVNCLQSYDGEIQENARVRIAARIPSRALYAQERQMVICVNRSAGGRERVSP